MNTLNTFDGSRDFIRPEYESLVDILGTQSHFDATATADNYGVLSSSGLEKAWVTRGSQEWYRQIDSTLGYTNNLRGSRAEAGYWGRYTDNWGAA